MGAHLVPCSILLALFSFARASVAAQPAPPVGEQTPALRDVFPHVRVDVKNRIVEFDARVPTVMDDPDMAPAFLEVIACIPDTKEHETLVVTEARPSHVHAALLMLGLAPGKPGSWEWVEQKLVPHQPAGDRVRVDFIYTDQEGLQHIDPANLWVKHDGTNEPLQGGEWIFAGSRMLDHGFGEMYNADGVGTLIGLATFGSETLAWPTTFSPDSETDEPVWVADPTHVPPVGTPVVVRLTPVR